MLSFDCLSPSPPNAPEIITDAGGSVKHNPVKCDENASCNCVLPALLLSSPDAAAAAAQAQTAQHMFPAAASAFAF